MAAPVHVLEASAQAGQARDRRSQGLAGSGIARGALALLSTQPITWGASLVTTVLLPRLLGGEGLGELSVALSFGGIAGTVVTLGLSEALVRRVAVGSDEAARDAGSSILLAGLFYALLAPLAVLFTMGTGFANGNPALFWLTLLSVGVTPMQGILLGVLRGQGRMGVFAWLNAGVAVSVTALSVLLVVLGAGAAGCVAASVVVNVASAVFGWRLVGLRPRFRGLDSGFLLQTARAGLPFLLWAVAMQFRSNVDRIVLAAMAPVAVVGWYAAAHRISGIPVFIPTLVATPLFPLLSRQASEGGIQKGVVQRSVTIVFLLTAPLCAAIVAFAPAIPSLVGWPAEFQQSVPLIMILALNLPLIGVDMVLGTTLMAARRETAWAWVGVIGGITDPLLNVLLIPLTQQVLANGAIGSALAFVLTELLMLTGALVLMPRGLVDRSDLGRLLRITLACLALIETVHLLLPLSPIAAGAAGGCIFLAVARGLNVIGEGDLRALWGVVAERFSRRLGSRSASA